MEVQDTPSATSSSNKSTIKSTIRVIVLGAAGRMSRAAIRLLDKMPSDPSIKTINAQKSLDFAPNPNNNPSNASYQFLVMGGIEHKSLVSRSGRHVSGQRTAKSAPSTSSHTKNQTSATLESLEMFTQSRTREAPLAVSFEELAAFYHNNTFVDVVIDFSHPTATLEHLNLAANYGNPAWVIGTTGFSQLQEKALMQASEQCVIVRSGNFSKGIHALIPLLKQAAVLLGSDYDIEITETHHRHKKDAPSGTAKMLAHALADARKLDHKKHIHLARLGETALRNPSDITLTALRGGGVIGEHTIHFIGQDERLAFTHAAISREAFASGIPAALAFAYEKRLAKTPALYQMHDVIDWLNCSND
ncbi:4-hydroxy-tetrahydrodipicolinate reductase [Spirochaetota bacterium]|nr:4-hydroxy-tetrahydrodipicolinate reductase [Spirochaetota bacterium]